MAPTHAWHQVASTLPTSLFLLYSAPSVKDHSEETQFDAINTDQTPLIITALTSSLDAQGHVPLVRAIERTVLALSAVFIASVLLTAA